MNFVHVHTQFLRDDEMSDVLLITNSNIELKSRYLPYIIISVYSVGTIIYSNAVICNLYFGDLSRCTIVQV